MLQMDGREHIQRRKIVAPQMGGNRLGSFGPVIDDVADGLARAAVAEAVAEGSVDLVARIAHRMPGTVIATMMGLPSDDLPRFFGWYHAMMAGLWTDLELRRRGRVAHHEFQEYLAPIAARSVRPGPDLISRLVQAEVDGDRMTGEDIGAFMSLLLTAGGETTDKAIANLWWLLLTNPDEYDRASEDPEHLDRAFSEMMRLYPSLIYLGRLATEPITRHDDTIPAGAVVRLAVASAHRDERTLAEPDRFGPPAPISIGVANCGVRRRRRGGRRIWASGPDHISAWATSWPGSRPWPSPVG